MRYRPVFALPTLIAGASAADGRERVAFGGESAGIAPAAGVKGTVGLPGLRAGVAGDLEGGIEVQRVGRCDFVIHETGEKGRP